MPLPAPITASVPPSPPAITIVPTPVPVFEVAATATLPRSPFGRAAGMSQSANTRIAASGASSGSFVFSTYGGSTPGS